MQRHTNTSPPRQRHRSWRTGALALAVTAAAFAAVPLASAKSTIDQDAVQLTEAGLDFGDNTFVDGAPTGNGTLKWVLNNGALTPRLQGTLHLKNVNDLCARMRMDFYNGTTLLKQKRGGIVCAPDAGHHSYRVDLRPYTDIRITKVIVRIESLTPIGWLPAISDTYWRTLTDDQVTIDTDGFDFGGAALVDDAPYEPATVDWQIIDGALTANVSGFLHINHNAGACAYVKVTPFTGNRTGHEDQSNGLPVVGPLHCAPDNADAMAYIDLDLLPSPQPIEALKVSVVSVTPGGLESEGSQFVYVSDNF